jgi:hypothetical protein
MKLNLWIDNINKQEFSFFDYFYGFVKENKIKFEGNNKIIITSIKEHLSGLIKTFDEYFPSKEEVVINDWIRNPFIYEKNLPNCLTIHEKSEFLDLICDKRLKDLWHQENLGVFWLECRATHPLLSDRAVKFLMPFYTSYLCEEGFSSLCYIKNKFRSKIADVEPCLRLKLSNVKPVIKKLSSKKQNHISH